MKKKADIEKCLCEYLERIEELKEQMGESIAINVAVCGMHGWICALKWVLGKDKKEV